MPHSRELLNYILEGLKIQYSSSEHEFILERRLNRVMMPDIQVWKGNSIECVVEIGYTRPDKLVHYVETGIKDIQWYNHAGRLCLTVDDGHCQIVARGPTEIAEIVKRQMHENMVAFEKEAQDYINARRGKP